MYVIQHTTDRSKFLGRETLSSRLGWVPFMWASVYDDEASAEAATAHAPDPAHVVKIN